MRFLHLTPPFPPARSVRLHYRRWFVVLLRKEIHCINIRCLAREKDI